MPRPYRRRPAASPAQGTAPDAVHCPAWRGSARVAARGVRIKAPHVIHSRRSGTLPHGQCCTAVRRGRGPRRRRWTSAPPASGCAGLRCGDGGCGLNQRAFAAVRGPVGVDRGEARGVAGRRRAAACGRRWPWSACGSPSCTTTGRRSPSRRRCRSTTSASPTAGRSSRPTCRRTRRCDPYWPPSGTSGQASWGTTVDVPPPLDAGAPEAWRRWNGRLVGEGRGRDGPGRDGAGGSAPAIGTGSASAAGGV